MLRICLSCQPLKTELQMGVEPQKNFLYIRWFLDRLESHCPRKDTQHPFWKGWKKCSKRWMTKDYSSTNTSEAKEGSKGTNSRNASHHNPRRNRKICNEVVSQKIISRNRSNNVESFTTGRAKQAEDWLQCTRLGALPTTRGKRYTNTIVSKTSKDRFSADWAKKRQYPQRFKWSLGMAKRIQLHGPVLSFCCYCLFFTQSVKKQSLDVFDIIFVYLLLQEVPPIWYIAISFRLVLLVQWQKIQH